MKLELRTQKSLIQKEIADIFKNSSNSSFFISFWANDKKASENSFSIVTLRCALKMSFVESLPVFCKSDNLLFLVVKFDRTGSVKDSIFMRSWCDFLTVIWVLLNEENGKLSLELNFSSSVNPGYEESSWGLKSFFILPFCQTPIPWP